MDVSRIAEEAHRLLPLARSVLERYPYDIRSVTHLATHSNVLFRVETRSGELMTLRVGAIRGNTRTNIDYEVAWLTALNAETDLEVVRPLPTITGKLVVDAYDSAIGKERACVLFSWIPGEPLGAGGPFGYRMLGVVSATLHNHGRDWLPPTTDALRLWDRVFYYGAEIDPVVISDPYYDHIFDGPMRSVIARATVMASEEITEAWDTDRPQVVHGDLHEWNVHMAKQRMHVFDFEDLMIALPSQDIAISLYHSRARPDREEVRNAFRRGYESVREWPEVSTRRLESFMAARQILLMNYAARTLSPAEAQRFIDSLMPWLAGYVDRFG